MALSLNLKSLDIFKANKNVNPLMLLKILFYLIVFLKKRKTMLPKKNLSEALLLNY